MKHVTIETLHARRFKGLRDFTLTLDGQTATVSGTNAMGKTSLLDAYKWVFTGKDSADSAVFGALHIEDGKPSTEAMVEVTLRIDGARKVFRRTMTEKTKGRRGSSERVKDGHEHAFTINEVPMPKKEFEQKVAELLGDADTVSLLSDVRHFNNALHWQARRTLLVSMAGDVTMADVIATNPDLADLPGILEDRDPLEHRKLVAAQTKAAAEAANGLPGRIDEVRRQRDALVADLAPLQQVQADEAEATRMVASLQQRIADVKADGGRAELRARLAEVNREIEQLESDGMRKLKDAEHAAALGVREAEAAHLRAKQDQALALDQAGRIARRAAEITEAVDALRAQYRTEAAKPLAVAHVEGKCAACGQSLPTEDVAAAHKAAQEAANTARAEALSAITRRANALQEEAQALEADPTDAERLAAAVATAEKALTHARNLLEAAQAATAAGVPNSPGRMVLVMERTSLTTKLEAPDDGAEQVAELTGQLEAARTKLEAAQRAQAAHQQAQSTLARETQLEADAKALAARREDLERQRWLLDEFTRCEAELLTERINGLFTVARVRLFDELLTEEGALKPTCVVTVKDVPYPDLNRGMQINVGLDVIAALQRHFGLALPVWVDNSESVVELLPVEGQMVRLRVDGAVLGSLHVAPEA